MKADFVVFVFLISYSTAERDLYAVKFLKDFSINDGQISYLSGFFCWDKETDFNLVKGLSLIGIYATVNKNCTIETFNTNHPQRTLFVIDLSCEIAENCLEMANISRLYSFPYKVMVLDSYFEDFNGSESTLASIENSNSINNITSFINEKCVESDVKLIECPVTYLSKYPLLVDSNVIFAKQIIEDVLLFQIYKRRHNDKSIIVETYGKWDQKNGITDIRKIKEIAVRRLNLHRSKVTTSIVITNNRTMSHLSDDKENHIDTFTKVNYALSAYLMDFVNSTPHFIFTTNWGYPMPKGGYSGMIGHLMHHEADIGGTPLFIKVERMSLIEYIALTTPTVHAFFFKEPPLSSVYNIFVLPFEWTVWVATVLLVTLSCISLYITNNFEDKYMNGEETKEICIFCENNEAKSSGQMGDVCLVAVGAVAQQGSVLEPQSIAGRITTLMLFLTLMFLYVSYSANIVALLQSESNNIKTLSDLLNSKLTLGADDLIYNRYYFPSFTDPVRKGIWDKKMSPGNAEPHFYPLEVGVKRMQKELFAFHMERGVGYKFINDLFTEDEKCGLNEIVFLDPIFPWFSIQKNTSYKDMFKIGMRRIQETGLQIRENLRFYVNKPMCSSKGSFVSVGLMDIRPALVWIGSGCCFAILLFLLEVISKLKFNQISQISGKIKQKKNNFTKN